MYHIYRTKLCTILVDIVCTRRELVHHASAVLVKLESIFLGNTAVFDIIGVGALVYSVAAGHGNDIALYVGNIEAKPGYRCCAKSRFIAIIVGCDLKAALGIESLIESKKTETCAGVVKYTYSIIILDIIKCYYLTDFASPSTVSSCLNDKILIISRQFCNMEITARIKFKLSSIRTPGSCCSVICVCSGFLVKIEIQILFQ